MACFRPVDALSDESESDAESESEAAAAAGFSERQHSEKASELRLAKSESFGDVTELSDEDLGPTFESGGSLPSNPKKRKRSTITADFKDKRLSEENIRGLLSSTCSKGCKLKCYSKFHVLTLKKFREEWLALHKLDQDQIVACQCHEVHVISCVN